MKRFLAPVIALAVFLGAWELGVRILTVRAFLLPPPSEIARAFVADRASLASSLLTTGHAALIGFALSGVCGVGAGVLLSSSRLFERALNPYTVFLQTVPIVAIAPLLVTWFGPGLRAVVASALIVSVFPVVANTLAGIRGVDPALRDLFRLYGASRFQTLVKLELPAALPNVVTGLRVASGLAIIGTIVGEFVAGFAEGDVGLGIKILEYNRQLKTAHLFAAVVLAALLGLAFFGAIGGIGARVLRRWHPSEKAP